ncbi:kda protein in nof-fb transposable element [Lasius niger]|uniref:KDa protein in nof-fb transposable element n=1 Tax=Lasius niger TaxID=67767 RepID=A0A0J7KS60_LASNI|nr:kda protein in nof-fb transposable element [Lasius niger]
MSDKDIQSSTVNDCNIWNTCEDWRGKAEKKSKNIAEPKESPIKKRAKPSYLDTCPEWEYIKDTKVCKLPVLKNGLFCDSIIMGKFRLNVKNTCAFDSPFQVIMSAMA